MKQAANGPSKLMSLLDKHQGKTGEAHMVIQLGAKRNNNENHLYIHIKIKLLLIYELKQIYKCMRTIE